MYSIDTPHCAVERCMSTIACSAQFSNTKDLSSRQCKLPDRSNGVKCTDVYQADGDSRLKNVKTHHVDKGKMRYKWGAETTG